MSQPVPRYCPRCGAELIPQQKFCVNCGFSFSSNVNAPSNPSVPPSDFVSVQQGPISDAGVPPLGQEPVSDSGIPPIRQKPASGAGVPLMQQGPASGAGQTPWQQASAMYAQRSKKRRFLVASVLLLVVILLLAGAGYMAWPLLFPRPVKPARPTVISKSINTTVDYAGTNVTVQQAQQAANFSNDPGTGSDGVVRVYLQSVNNNSQPIVLDYTTITTLVSSKGTTYKPIYIHDEPKLAAGQTQAGYVDFSVPTTVSLANLTFRLGTASEAQLSVPLSGHFNANEYASTTMTENAQVYYFGLNWSVDTTSSQLNLNGQQADANDRFAVITLQVSSNLSEDTVVGSPFDYLRLVVNGTTLSPLYTTLPVSFKSGVTDQKGTVAFMVPQSASSGTLVFQGTDQNGFDQQTASLVLK